MRKSRRFGLVLFICCVASIYAWFSFVLPRAKYNIPVSKIYVINLDRSKERLETISKALNAQNIEFTRFPAILGLDLKIQGPSGVFLGSDKIW